MYKSSAVRSSQFLYPPSTAALLSMQDAVVDDPLDVQTTQAEIDEQLEKARDEGRREGKSAAESAHLLEFASLRESVMNAIQDFAVERAKYFAQIEAEVVQLAVAIAKRILHRETQVDSGLLLALVRAHLQELDKTTSISIQVNPALVNEWRNSFNDVSGVEILGDHSTPKHSCRLKTNNGSTELSIDAQLSEIENGLFDLFPKLPNPVKQVLQ